MTMNKKDGPVLAIVVPCYNEEEVLLESAAILNRFLQSMIDSAEVSADSYILLVDDGSKDRTDIPNYIKDFRNFQNIVLCGYKESFS